MSLKFEGFAPKAIGFLRQLSKNNDRDWFKPRKPIFDELVRGPMIALVEAVASGLRDFAIDHVLPPEKAVQRIYRDTRFSKDKTPYKSQQSAMFPRHGLGKGAGASYYMSLSAERFTIAAGMFHPEPDELKYVRAKLADDGDRFKAVISDKRLVRSFGRCQISMSPRLPKDAPPDHPHSDLYRLRDAYFAVELDSADATRPTIVKKILDRFELVSPVLDLINAIALKWIEVIVDDTPRRPAPMF